MPAMPKDMSWLSPKRRRTTGNLKGGIPNGQAGSNGDAIGSPEPSVPPVPAVAIMEKRPKTPRPVSQPQLPRSRASSSGGAAVGGGSLFYAYARKGDDLKSRYLLTFASVAVANEWWLHLQDHFPDTTRPGPQLFSFKTDDLLGKAWRHPSMTHLKTKWMYIAFSDATGDVGGAAKGVIPIQDANGNMMGNSAGRDASIMGEVKQETREVKNEVQRLEEHFEKMMEAMEKNTNRVAELAEQQQKFSESKEDYMGSKIDSNGTSGITYMDMDVLSGHFGRMSDLLSKHNEHIDTLSKKQDEHEENLRTAIENLNGRHKIDYLDMQQLSSHLEKIQNLIASSATERKDSAKDLPPPQVQIDFSPLIDKLEKVQEAVEQNSALIKELLEEGTGGDSKPGTPFWGKDQAPVDLLPLTAHLERIHGAIEQQSEHTKALVNYASGDLETSNTDNTVIQGPTSLAPLAEHLEQIYNAVDEGNKQAQRNNDRMDKMLEAQKLTCEAIEANGGELDFTPLAEHLEAIRESSDTNAATIKELLETQRATHKDLDFTPLTEHLGAIRSATEQHSSRIKDLVASQQGSGDRTPVDFSPMTERLKSIHKVLEKQSEQQRAASPGTGDSKFIMSALTSHLSKIQGVTEQNATHVKQLRERQALSQNKMQNAVSETSDQVRELVSYHVSSDERIASTEKKLETQNAQLEKKLEAQHTQHEKKLELQTAQMREMMSGQREMVEVMRSLAKSITAQNKNACDHVVVPPPRKMGKKIVGFVYDAKENGA